jgi:hypothetical protein
VSAKAPRKGNSAKHAGTKKHASAAAKHAAHVAHVAHLAHEAHLKAIGKAKAVAKPAAHAKPRAFAVGDLLPVCAFEAIAMSLRLAGQRVADDDVAGLWELCGAPSAGVPIGQALAAAALFGLAGTAPTCRPVQQPRTEALLARARIPGDLADFAPGHALILGIDAPGPHCVLATPRGWWSWGELYDPWPARIEEAWAVSWA